VGERLKGVLGRVGRVRVQSRKEGHDCARHDVEDDLLVDLRGLVWGVEVVGVGLALHACSSLQYRARLSATRCCTFAPTRLPLVIAACSIPSSLTQPNFCGSGVGSTVGLACE
jgi:hypothetical protein